MRTREKGIKGKVAIKEKKERKKLPNIMIPLVFIFTGTCISTMSDATLHRFFNASFGRSWTSVRCNSVVEIKRD